MKYKVLAVLLLSVVMANAQNSVSDFFTKADTFFSSYVKDGKVAYNKLSKNDKELAALIDMSNTIAVDKSDENTYKAFWINVYNLGVIEQIVENYPVNSPMKINGFFSGNKRNLGGKKITLNDIENKLLRGNFKEPRFHFVLVCGAVSCPPIVDYAYTPSQLESQLEKQTKLALNNDDFIRVANGKANISEIFNWYKQDFGSSKSKVAAYINSYRNQKISDSFGYYTYNWQLNNQASTSLVSGNDNTASVSTPELSNVQTFTPSKLLAKNQFDVKFFNSLYTQTKSADENSDITKNLPRQNFFTSTLEFYYGITESARINVGFIAQARANTFNGKSALSVFEFEDDKVNSRSGITTFAPSVRIQPIASVPNFSFTSSVFLPIFEKEQNGYLDKNSVFWETKFFFDHTFGNNQWQVFTEADFGFNFGEKGSGENFANNSLALPLSVFLSYFPTSKSTIFVNAQQFFLIDLGNDFEQRFTQIGFGGKYQVTDRLNLEASYGRFVAGNNSGIGEAFSLGLRFLSAN